MMRLRNGRGNNWRKKFALGQYIIERSVSSDIACNSTDDTRRVQLNSKLAHNQKSLVQFESRESLDRDRTHCTDELEVGKEITEMRDHNRE